MNSLNATFHPSSSLHKDSSNLSSGFISFTHSLIEEYRNLGHQSAVEHLSTTLNSFIRFQGEDDIPFDKFDATLISRYECHLKLLNLSLNTISYYMRKLRSIYNQAVERQLTAQRLPFRNVYTGVAKTMKRALSIDIIKDLRKMDLSSDPRSAFARDIFLFSFYTRGMAFVDIVFLKRCDLHDGILSYRRHKTGCQLYIHWEMPMQEIVMRHGIEGADYLLPFIKNPEHDIRRQYQNASHLINRRLKKLGVRLGLSEPLTMYCARHAWASIAHANDVPVSVISQGLGHDSEKTTRIYLASLNASIIDNANRKILTLLDS